VWGTTDSLVVCPDLEPGRYRFVFWEPDVAVAFDLVACYGQLSTG
jgi:hypothetical protein